MISIFTYLKILNSKKEKKNVTKKNNSRGSDLLS